MLQFRSFNSRSARVLIGVLAAAVLAPQGPAKADVTTEHEVKEVGCEGILISVEVPPGNVEPLVPAPFTANQPKFATTVRLDVVMQKCEEYIIRGNQYEDVVFAHALVDLEKWPEGSGYPEEPVDSARGIRQYQFWLAASNPGVVDYYRKRGGADVRLVRDLSYEEDRNSVSFKAPEPTPWPFDATARLGPRAVLVDFPGHLFRAVPDGIQYIEVEHVLRLGALTDWTITPKQGSQLDDVLCGSPKSFQEDVKNVGATFEHLLGGSFTATHYKEADVGSAGSIPRCQHTG